MALLIGLDELGRGIKSDARAWLVLEKGAEGEDGIGYSTIAASQAKSTVAFLENVVFSLAK